MKPENITYLSDLHFDHKQWNSELSFWKGEINYFEKQLAEVVQKARDNYVLGKAEHFQNLFTIHREVIDAIKDKIDAHEGQLTLIMQARPAEVDKKHFQDHSSLRDRVNIQRTLFREMKEDFFLFLSHVGKI